MRTKKEIKKNMNSFFEVKSVKSVKLFTLKKTKNTKKHK